MMKLFLYDLFVLFWMIMLYRLFQKKQDNRSDNRIDIIKSILLALINAVFIRWILEASLKEFPFSPSTFHHWPIYALVNIVSIFIVISAVNIVTNNNSISGCIVIVMACCVSLINYYTIMWHGSVVTIQDILSIKTALNVLSNYKLKIDKVVLIILVITFISLFLNVVANRLLKLNNKSSVLLRISCFIVPLLLIVPVYYGAGNIMPRVIAPWIWRYTYEEYGLFAGVVESTLSYYLDIIVKPDDYSLDRVNEYLQSHIGEQLKKSDPDSYPDIIIILNETYYDIDHLVDIYTDIDYMQYYNSLCKNNGYVNVAGIGGGTNATEYELLTSNSLGIINTANPTCTHLINHCYSVVNYLEDLGYVTMAAHPNNGENYRRSFAWPILGFDKVYFIDDFEHRDLFRIGDRSYTSDKAAYIDFIDFYNKLPKDKPRFGFLLTMQNHGGWDMNSEEYDTVHLTESIVTASDTVKLEINEFLSCMKESDEALKYLIDYYSSSYDRNVIIAMIGDHAPYWITDIYNEKLSNDENNLLRRQTPLFIWSNIDDDNTIGTYENTIDVCRVVPEILMKAKMPLSVYYDSILQIDGDIFRSELDEDKMKDYFCLEYNNLEDDTNRVKALFEPLIFPNN